MFLVKDVADWVEHSNPSKMLADAELEESEFTKITISYKGDGSRVSPPLTLLFVSEDGLYEILMQSRKPIAKAFKKEVKIILKTIRKHGVYATEDTIDKMLNDPDFAIKTFTKLKEEREARKLAEQKVEELEEVVSTKQTTIDLLTKQLIKIADRKLLNALVRDRGGCVGYQEAYRSLYSVFLTRCSIDVYRRASYRDCSKIDCINKNEWAKVMPVTVAWYLENGGSQIYLQELVKGKVEVNAVSQQ